MHGGTKKKLVLEYNGSEYWIASHWIEKKRWIKFEWLMKTVEDLNLQHADLIVVVSEVLQQELLGRGIKKKNIVVNPNGVDVDIFGPAGDVMIKKVENAKLHSEK